MHFLLLFITAKRDWETYYGEVFKQTEQFYYVGNNIAHRYYTSGNIYVKNSLFESLKASTNGGGICCENVAKFLAEDTQFVSCTSSASGGAIHFSYSNIVLHKVCGFDCKTQGSGADKDGPFANVYVTKNSQSKNYIIESQISHCNNPNYGFMVSMHYGKISHQYANESRNTCSQCSVFYLESYDADGNASYSSFCNNIASFQYCFFIKGTSSFELSNCNLIYNSAGAKLFNNEAKKFIIKGSCILNNQCNNNFFYRNGNQQYEIINCTLDCKGKMSGNYFITGSMYSSNTFIVALNLLNTGNCYGTYDVIGTLTPIIPTLGTLTPIIPTPNETPIPTKNLYIIECSCKNNKSRFMNLSYITLLLLSK